MNIFIEAQNSKDRRLAMDVIAKNTDLQKELVNAIILAKDYSEDVKAGKLYVRSITSNS